MFYKITFMIINYPKNDAIQSRIDGEGWSQQGPRWHLFGRYSCAGSRVLTPVSGAVCAAVWALPPSVQHSGVGGSLEPGDPHLVLSLGKQLAAAQLLPWPGEPRWLPVICLAGAEPARARVPVHVRHCTCAR